MALWSWAVEALVVRLSQLHWGSVQMWGMTLHCTRWCMVHLVFDVRGFLFLWQCLGLLWAVFLTAVLDTSSMTSQELGSCYTGGSILGLHCLLFRVVLFPCHGFWSAVIIWCLCSLMVGGDGISQDPLGRYWVHDCLQHLSMSLGPLFGGNL